MEAGGGGGGFEVCVAEFEGEGAGEEVLFAELAGGACGEGAEGGADVVVVEGVAGEGVFTGDGFGGGLLGDDGGVVYALRAEAEGCAPGAEDALEHGGGDGGDMAEGVEVEFAQLSGGGGTDAGEFFQGEVAQEGGFVAGFDEEDAVGFGAGGGDFGDEFAGGDADGDGEAGFFED